MTSSASSIYATAAGTEQASSIIGDDQPRARARRRHRREGAPRNSVRSLRTETIRARVHDGRPVAGRARMCLGASLARRSLRARARQLAPRRRARQVAPQTRCARSVIRAVGERPTLTTSRVEHALYSHALRRGGGTSAAYFALDRVAVIAIGKRCPVARSGGAGARCERDGIERAERVLSIGGRDAASGAAIAVVFPARSTAVDKPRILRGPDDAARMAGATLEPSVPTCLRQLTGS